MTGHHRIAHALTCLKLSRCILTEKFVVGTRCGHSNGTPVRTTHVILAKRTQCEAVPSVCFAAVAYLATLLLTVTARRSASISDV
jgi:hypothetical protein